MVRSESSITISLPFGSIVVIGITSLSIAKKHINFPIDNLRTVNIGIHPSAFQGDKLFWNEIE